MAGKIKEKEYAAKLERVSRLEALEIEILATFSLCEVKKNQQLWMEVMKITAAEEICNKKKIGKILIIILKLYFMGHTDQKKSALAYDISFFLNRQACRSLPQAMLMSSRTSLFCMVFAKLYGVSPSSFRKLGLAPYCSKTSVKETSFSILNRLSFC